MHPGLSYSCLCTAKHDLAKIRIHIIIPRKLRITLIMLLKMEPNATYYGFIVWPTHFHRYFDHSISAYNSNSTNMGLKGSITLENSLISLVNDSLDTFDETFFGLRPCA